MFHQLLHCQPRIVAHRLARALQQSGVPALRPGNGRGQRMSVRFGNAGQQNLGETVHQGEQGLLRSIQRHHPLPDPLDAGSQSRLGTDQFLPLPGQILLHGMAEVMETGRPNAGGEPRCSSVSIIKVIK
jgi:hypothetical protein